MSDHQLRFPAATRAVLAVAAVGASLALPQSTRARRRRARPTTSRPPAPTRTTAPLPAAPSRRSAGRPASSSTPVTRCSSSAAPPSPASSPSGSPAPPAAPITIGAYGSGNKPVVTGDCLEVGGSYITMTDFTVAYCTTERHLDRRHRQRHHQRRGDPQHPRHRGRREHATNTKVRPQLPAPQRPDGAQHPRRVRRLRRRRRGGAGRQHRGRLQHDHRQLGALGRLRHRRLGGRDLRRHRHRGPPQHRQQQPDLHRAGQQPLRRHDLRLQPGHLEPARTPSS